MFIGDAIQISKLQDVFDRTEQKYSSLSSSGNLIHGEILLDEIKKVDKRLYNQLNANINGEFVIDGGNGGYQETTLLNFACEKNYLQIVKSLLSENMNASIISEALQLATSKGHLEVVRELLNREASTRAIDISLIAAASKDHLEIVQELLNRGANVDSVDNFNNTPLHIAAGQGHLEVVQELLNRGANVDAVNNFNNTPLFIAAFKGHTEVVRELLIGRADVNAADDDNNRPLHGAAEKGHLEVMRELLIGRANVDAVNNDNNRPLHLAAFKGHTEVVRELLDRKADVNKVSNSGITPLHLAAFKGHTEVVRELLDRRADVNKVENSDITPLHLAAQNGHLEVVKKLLDRGANANVLASLNVTPLHLATQNGHLEVVKKLLDRGADIKKQNNNGHTPLEHSIVNGSEGFIRTLIKYTLAQDINTQKPDFKGLSGNEWQSRYWDEYKSKIESVRTINIPIEGEDVSFYDFLTANDAKLESYLRKLGGLLNFELKVRKWMEEIFPQLPELNEVFIYKAYKVARALLYKEIEEQMSFYREGASKPLPEDLVYKINKYLSHEDRQNLLSLANENGEILLNLASDIEYELDNEELERNLELKLTNLYQEKGNVLVNVLIKNLVEEIKKIGAESDKHKAIKRLFWTTLELGNSGNRDFVWSEAQSLGIEGVALLKEHYFYSAKCAVNNENVNAIEWVLDHAKSEKDEGNFADYDFMIKEAFLHAATWNKVDALGILLKEMSIEKRINVFKEDLQNCIVWHDEVFEGNRWNSKPALTFLWKGLNGDERNRVLGSLSENLRKKFDTLREKYDELKEKSGIDDEESPGSSKVACLPGARQKREADNDCLYSWEDIDEFNEEKDVPRNLDEVQINSKKFLIM